MASPVKIDMVPESQQSNQQFAEVGLDCVASGKHIKTRQFRSPSARDFVILIAFLSCGMTFYLLYAKICSIEQTMNQQQQQFPEQSVAANSVVMDASAGSKEEIPIHALHKETEKELKSGRKDSRSLIKTLNRSKKNAHHGDAAWNSAALYPNADSPEHVFIHVTGITSNVVTLGDWFMWHTDEEPAYENLATTSLLPFVLNKFVEIRQAGFYFIYSQITYKDSNSFQIGHEVIRRPNCGNGDDQRLLNSIRLQMDPNSPSGVPQYPEDSGYVGAVFHLSANDYVGVRPLMTGGQRARQFVANQGTGCYFGMFLLLSDSDSPIMQGACGHGGGSI
ncbi:uncharacterized protein [Amphiura filiformis]|uniref:uncharacterized protein n=1 Tax=Amphiura filiformis TaxID=82378 RepID=UPI003B20BDB5